MSERAPEDARRKDLLKRAIDKIEELQARLDATERRQREPIAIIGFGCRFPGGANDPEAFWELLQEGRDPVREVPADRWDVDAFYDADPEAPGKMYTRCGSFLDGVDGFDPEFFGIAPRETVGMDPQQRLLLEVSWEALEHAGHAPTALAGSLTGVFVGIGSRDYSQLQMGSNDPSAVDVYSGTGGAHSIASGRIAYSLGLQGPAITVDTACSSSLVAVHLACQALRTDDCDLAVAGGVNLILSPISTLTASRAQMLSPDGRCKTFAAAADGYGRGEGCGVVVLKRLQEALRDGDNVLALVRGTASNQDGRSSGLTAPSGPAQEAVIRRALERSGIPARRLRYVETHGTGTSLGDPIEVQALAAVLGQGRPADDPVGMGSVKTNIGHLEAAAGIAGLIKMVLALQHEEIPPHLHFDEPNPLIPWDRLPVRVIGEPTPWPIGDEPRLAGVSSFGFSGTNVHVVVEEAPAVERAAADRDRPLHLFTLSARSGQALLELADRHAVRLARVARDREEGAAAPMLPDICFTANAGRAHFPCRAFAIGATLEGLREQLAELAAEPPRPAVSRRPQIAFLYTGQGSQYSGMGRELYDTQPTFRDALQRCAELLGPHLDEPLLEVLYGDKGELLDQTAYTQPALFALEYALTRMWRSWGVEPDLVLGHSVGEYVAACVAGVFSLQDGLSLVAERARLMQRLPAGGAMASVMTDEKSVAALLEPWRDELAIAAINGPQATVISGAAEALDAALAKLREEGVKSKRLAVSHAFHSPLMDPMLEEFEGFAGTLRFRPPQLVMVSNVSGAPVPSNETLQAEYWRRHVRQPVRFRDSIEAARVQGCRIFVEIGPRPVLSGMGRACLDDDEIAWLPSLRQGRGDWEQLLPSLGELYVRGTNVDWHGFDRDYPRRRVALPTYPFQRQRYWIEPAAAPAPTRTDDLYELVWREGDRSVEVDSVGAVRWLVLAGEPDGIGVALAEHLRDRGHSCRVVCRGSDWPEMPTAQQLAELVTDEAGEGSPLRVVYLWGMGSTGTEDEEPTVASLWEAQRWGCGGLLHLVQALAAAEPVAAKLYVVTRGAQAAAEAQAGVALAQAPVWGLARTIALEHPELGAVRIDVDPRSPAGEVEQLAAELLGDGIEDQVALRDGRRRVARLARLAPTDPGRRPDIRGDASYLITGGLGGLGLVVARWLLDSGAGNVVLSGRSELSPAKRERLAELQGLGGQVCYARGDIAERDDAARLLRDIRASGAPLAGIVHAAGVLDDGVLTGQSWERFVSVMEAKVAGAWNLHELTWQQPLDFFLLFSAGAALLGSPGQGNYAAANAFLDALAQRRRSDGLAALSVNWGPWEGVGMAAALQRQHRERHAGMGIEAITPEEGIAALDCLLARTVPQVAVLRVHDWDAMAALAPSPPPLLAELSRRADPRARRSRTSELEVRRRLQSAAPAERREVATAYVREQVCKVMGIDPLAPPDLDRPLGELGLDSLMATQLKNQLDRLGAAVPLAWLLEGPSTGHLVDAILSLRSDEVADTIPIASAVAGGAANEAEDLLSRLPELSEQQVDSLLDDLLADGNAADE